MASRSGRRPSASDWSRPGSSRVIAAWSFGAHLSSAIPPDRAARSPRSPPAAPGSPDRLAVPEGDTLHRTAIGLAPHLVGRSVTAARAPMGGPQVQRVIGATITSVEAVGKNLLIRFDNGL